MNAIIISYPGNETLTASIAKGIDGKVGEIQMRHFPDGETYVRLVTDVLEKRVFVVASLHRPDDKFLSLVFFSTFIIIIRANILADNFSNLTKMVYLLVKTMIVLSSVSLFI